MMDSLSSWLKILGISILTPLSLFAQGPQGTPVKIGSNTNLTLPAGWKVLESHEDAAPEQAKSSLDVKGSALLLTARPQDPRRRTMLSVYRVSFQSPGPGPLEGEKGIQAETEKLLCNVLNVGYSPSNIQSSTSTTANGTRFLSLEITAKNQAGDERVFSEVAVGDQLPILRLSTSRAKNDDVSAQEFAYIVSSLAMRETLAGKVEVNPPKGSEEVKQEPQPEVGQLVSEFSEALVIIDGKDAVGSGFICKTDDKHAFVYTNAHVATASGGFKLTNLKSAVLNPGASGIAVDHDIMRIEIKDPAKAFSILENLDTAAKIGDDVVVLGNMHGGMVVKPVEGKIQGIGPNLIEVDAPFESGNSGSPIVHRKTGKVIGIATYLSQRKIDNHKGSVSTEVRRFGYRLDSVKTWEAINWPVFFAQASAYRKIDDVSNDFIKFCNTKGDARVDVSSYQSPAMQRVIQNLIGRTKGRTGNRYSQGERKMLIDQMLSDLRSIAKNDLPSFDMRTAYDYFRRGMEEQIKFRDDIYKDISKTIDQSVF